MCGVFLVDDSTSTLEMTHCQGAYLEFVSVCFSEKSDIKIGNHRLKKRKEVGFESRFRVWVPAEPVTVLLLLESQVKAILDGSGVSDLVLSRPQLCRNQSIPSNTPSSTQVWIIMRIIWWVETGALNDLEHQTLRTRGSPALSTLISVVSTEIKLGITVTVPCRSLEPLSLLCILY